MPSVYKAVPGRQTLDFSFQVSDTRKGEVAVVVEENNEPQNYGCDLLLPDHPGSHFKDFPICEAKVRSTGAKGYGSIYGWIQVFRCNDSLLTEDDHWEMDPVPLHSDLNTPFCWFGPEPSLFDCPMRDRRKQCDWDCHSFLTYSDDCLISKEVRPILGFCWGFSIRDGQVVIKALEKLDMNIWDGHLSLLREKHPGWDFGEYQDCTVPTLRWPN